MNKRALESLVKCGALDSTGALAAWGCSTVLEQALAYGQTPAGRPARRARRSIFDLGGSARRRRRPTPPPADPDRRVREARAPAAREGDARPLRLRASAPRASATSCGARPTARSPSSSAAATARSSRSAASSRRVKQLTTKKGEPMVFLRARRPDRLRPRSSSSTRPTRPRASCCVADRILVVKGRVDHKQQGETKLDRDRGDARSRRSPERREVRLQARRARRRRPGSSASSPTLVREFPGEAPVYVALETSLRPADARARPGVPRRARGGLLRRGARAPRARRSCRRQARPLRDRRVRLGALERVLSRRGGRRARRSAGMGGSTASVSSS